MRFMNNGSYLKKTGILGGTFNPIHNGHLIMAENAMRYCGLDNVMFIPSGCSYLKDARLIASKEHRLKMCELAIKGYEGFELSTVETDRSGDSHTYKTLDILRTANPDTRFYLITGADTFLYMANWVKPEMIFPACTVVCMPRDGHDISELKDAAKRYENTYNADVIITDSKEVDISSSYIREMLALGNDCSDLLDKDVIEYIKENGLYGNDRY